MIEWNKVTWYSKLGAILLFILVVPVLTFYIGVKYQETRDLLSDSSALTITNESKLKSDIERVCDFITGKNSRDSFTKGKNLESIMPFVCNTEIGSGEKKFNLTIRFETISKGSFSEFNVLVENSAGSVIKKLSSLGDGEEVGDFFTKFYSSSFAIKNDYNFDGYNDIDFQINEPASNGPDFKIYLFNPSTITFDETTIPGGTFDKEKRQISYYHSMGWAGNLFYSSVYSFENRKWVLSQEVSAEQEGDHILKTTKTYKDGKLVNTKEETLPAPF